MIKKNFLKEYTKYLKMIKNPYFWVSDRVLSDSLKHMKPDYKNGQYLFWYNKYW